MDGNPLNRQPALDDTSYSDEFNAAVVIDEVEINEAHYRAESHSVHAPVSSRSSCPPSNAGIETFTPNGWRGSYLRTHRGISGHSRDRLRRDAALR